MNSAMSHGVNLARKLRIPVSPLSKGDPTIIAPSWPLANFSPVVSRGWFRTAGPSWQYLGTRKITRLEENIAALSIVLSETNLAQIEAAFEKGTTERDCYSCKAPVNRLLNPRPQPATF